MVVAGQCGQSFAPEISHNHVSNIESNHAVFSELHNDSQPRFPAPALLGNHGQFMNEDSQNKEKVAATHPRSRLIGCVLKQIGYAPHARLTKPTKPSGELVPTTSNCVNPKGH